jgi:basic membrane protein A and related proteins
MKPGVLLLGAAGVAVLLLSCHTTIAAPESAPAEPVALRVGLVFDTVGRGDKSYCDLAYQGLVQIAKVYNGWIEGGDPDSTDFGRGIDIKCMQPSEDGHDSESLVRALAQDGYQLIYCISSQFTEAVRRVSRDFPHSHFMLVDSYIPDLKERNNVTCLLFREDESAFLVGAIAAIKADGKPIGFLGGVDIPYVRAIQNAFIGGAIYADRRYRDESLILRAYVDNTAKGFSDPGHAYTISKDLYERGATIVFHRADDSGGGLFLAAAEADKKAIGSRADQGLICEGSRYPRVRRAGEAILTSAVNRIDSAVFLSGRDFLDKKGQAAGGYRWFGFLESGVDFAMNKHNKDQLDGFFATILHVRSDIVGQVVTVPNAETAMDIWAAQLK